MHAPLPQPHGSAVLLLGAGMKLRSLEGYIGSVDQGQVAPEETPKGQGRQLGKAKPASVSGFMYLRGWWMDLFCVVSEGRG